MKLHFEGKVLSEITVASAPGKFLINFTLFVFINPTLKILTYAF